jgi:Kef-type K+ transport system membrane component KefB
MPAISFNSVLIIAGVAVLVPALLGAFPRLPVPGAVLEVVAGIVVGPAVLGWVRVDAPVQVLSDLGLGMLLFLAGLEIDIDQLRGPGWRARRSPSRPGSRCCAVTPSTWLGRRPSHCCWRSS